MIQDFNTAVGNLIAHFFKKYRRLLMKDDIWLIGQCMECNDDTFVAFEFIADILQLALTSEDCAALCKFEDELRIAKGIDAYNALLDTPCLN